jgi:hypothetical protein
MPLILPRSSWLKGIFRFPKLYSLYFPHLTSLPSPLNRIREPVVVGLELSGDPYKNLFPDFAPAFLKARSLGIPTSLHFAEANIRQEEMDEMLDTDPQRFVSFLPM